MTYGEFNELADIRLVAIRCADKWRFLNEEDNRLGLCRGNAVIGRDGPGTRRRCCARRGFGRRRAWTGRRSGRCFCGLCGRTVDCERLGIAAIKPLQAGPQARDGGAGRDYRRKRACPSNPYCDGCIACSSTAGCAIAATCAKERNSHAAGAAAGMRALGMRAFAELHPRPARIFL